MEMKTPRLWLRACDRQRAALCVKAVDGGAHCKATHRGALCITGWSGDPMRVNDIRLRLDAWREMPAPALP